MKVERGSKTIKQICNVVREGLVGAMQHGATLAINCEMFLPDWKTQYNKPEDLDLFDTNKIFDCKWFRAEENYKCALTQDEDRDNDGNRGCFHMRSEFQMALCYNYTSLEHIQKVIASIPHSDQFEVCKVINNNE